MAKLLRLANVGTSAAAVAAQTGVRLTGTPFQRGFNMLAHIDTKGMTGAPVIRIQQADNLAFTGATDLFATSGILTDEWVAEITPTQEFVRVNVTTAAGAGTYQAYFTAGGAP
jgi:hypothetical protein